MSFKSNLLNHLEELSDLMDFNKENKFKVGAFKNGANIIRRAEGDIESRIIDGSLFDLKGIGKGLKSVILEFYETGASTEYKAQKSDVPDGIMELMNIRGLGARKVRLLYDELKIQNLEELESACRDNKIAGLKGFGAKTADSVLREIERLKKGSGYVLLNYALKEGENILEKLSGLKNINKIIFTGELRRIREIISKIEILVLTDSSQSFKEELFNIYKYNDLEGDSSSKIVQLDCDVKVPVLVYLVENENEFMRTLFLTTGSDEFLAKLEKFDKTSLFSKEEEVFKSINFPFVIPEMREERFFDLKDEKRINSDLETFQV